MPRHIVLVGLPGSGKSTVGKLVAEALGAPLIDIDGLLVDTCGGHLVLGSLQTHLAHTPDLREERPPAAPFRRVDYFFLGGAGGVIEAMSARAALVISACAAARSVIGVPSPG